MWASQCKVALSSVTLLMFALLKKISISSYWWFIRLCRLEHWHWESYSEEQCFLWLQLHLLLSQPHLHNIQMHQKFFKKNINWKHRILKRVKVTKNGNPKPLIVISISLNSWPSSYRRFPTNDRVYYNSIVLHYNIIIGRFVNHKEHYKLIYITLISTSSKIMQLISLTPGPTRTFAEIDTFGPILFQGQFKI